MIRTFNREEKMALIAIMKFIVNSEGVIADSELEKFNEIAEQKGFEDFNEIFNEVDSEVNSIDDIIRLIKKVDNDTHKKDIIRYAVDIAQADGVINESEVEILNIMGKEWNI